MNKSNIIKEIANNLNAITVSLETLIEVLDKTREKQTTSVITDNSVATTQIEPITLEQVRAVLAAKSQSGKQPEVKALIQKYGAEKLTALDKACYKDLLKDAEEL